MEDKFRNFIKEIFIEYLFLGIVLDTGNIALKNRDKNFYLPRAYILIVGGEKKK